jgi:hypothetical protein
MAKMSGLAWTTMGVAPSATPTVVTDVRNDCTNLDWTTPRAVQDVTGIDKSAHERLLLLADFTLNLSGVMNTALSHLVFRDCSSTSVDRLTNITVGGASLSNTVVITDYPVTRSTNGDLTWKVPMSLADGGIPTWS